MRRIYFVQSGRKGPVKIGVTDNLVARINDLQVAHHSELFLLASGPGDEEKERRIHACLAEDRIRGEWFRPSARVLAAAEALRETETEVLVGGSVGTAGGRAIRKYQATKAQARP